MTKQASAWTASAKFISQIEFEVRNSDKDVVLSSLLTILGRRQSSLEDFGRAQLHFECEHGSMASLFDGPFELIEICKTMLSVVQLVDTGYEVIFSKVSRIVSLWSEVTISNRVGGTNRFPSASS